MYIIFYFILFIYYFIIIYIYIFIHIIFIYFFLIIMFWGDFSYVLHIDICASVVCVFLLG